MRGVSIAAIALCAVVATPAQAADPSAEAPPPSAAAAASTDGAASESAGAAATSGSADAAPSGAVARAQVTTAVVDREPTDTVDRVSGTVDSLAYFSELVGLEGQTVSHVWERQGVEMARVDFAVGGPRWRVHSTKRLDPSWVGAWRVVVVDAGGAELRSDHFYYAPEDSAADAGAGAAETPPAAPAPD